MAYRQERREHKPNNYGRKKPRIGYSRLKELENESPDNILNIISNHHSGFVDLISMESLKPDWISLILDITSKACKYCEEPLTGYGCIRGSSGNFDSSRQPSARLMTYLNDVRVSKFLVQCLPFFCSFLTEHCGQRKRKFCQDIKNVLVLCKTMLNTMPNNIEQVLPLITSVEMVVRTLRSQAQLRDDGEELESMLREANHLCQHVMEAQSSVANDMQKAKKQRTHREQPENEPTRDFRQLPIFPTDADLLFDLNIGSLPMNNVSSRYSSVESYLDTHFRLLREDFMRPLRQGIRDYLNTARNPRERQRLQNAPIYQKAYIEHPVCTSDGICYNVSFDVSRLHGVRWESTKRLIYGALLCLSPDSFKTVYFATVSHRDPEQLKKGRVELRFQNATAEVDQIGTQQKLVMAESPAYFEAYRHVLQGLKNLHEGDLPFIKYLVNCEPNIQIPQYLREAEKPAYDLSQLVDSGRQLPHMTDDCDIRDVDVLQKHSWPTAEMLGLDDQQLEAIQLALTKELAIIQGPPGTGKTYIGLKIVRALLQNDQYWSVDGETRNNPILLICYTNHALDQFLEEISKFVQKGIVRVGGRSRSQALEQFMLRELRKVIRERRDIPIEVHRNRMDAMDEQGRLRSEIERLCADIDVSTKGFLHKEHLEPYMDERHFEQLQNRPPSNYHRKSQFSEWLGIDNGKAFRLYTELTTQKPNNNEWTQNDGSAGEEDGVMDDDEMEAEEANEYIEENRVLQGVDDLDRRTVDSRHKTIMAKALESIAFKFSDLISKHDKATREDITEEVKIQSLLGINDIMSEAEARDTVNIWRLDTKERWRLYRYWLKQYKENLHNKLRDLEKEYELAARRLCEVKQREDLEIMKRGKILGMTTTAAARYQNLLHEIQPRIIIVEEAAEVLEAHIITALTSGCQHLILIGDHKQLRPNPTDYKIAESRKLKISLFERLVNNNLPHVVLGLQHRMPANISKLLTHVYKQKLQDHPSVLDCSPIRGLTTNIFFVDHKQPEVENKDLRSRANIHEANYVLSLSKYLLLQGYGPDQITILTPYTGQLAIIRKRLREKQMQGIRACAIDNFQGEENDIILVSLVRSNDEGRIGFVGDDNRICVTLSRAKKGMILIGDSLIMSQMNELWSKVIQSLRSDRCFGPALTLRCINHPHRITLARSAKDFDKTPEGGCMQPCQARLTCGHACRRICHAYDREHREYRCLEKCQKRCRNGHPCQKKCFEPCGNCMTMVKSRLIRCQHIQMIPCYKNNTDYKCRAPCSVKLPCGHDCQNKCGEPHTTYCRKPVTRKLSCGHEMVAECHVDPADVCCTTKCNAFLKCGHQCAGTCGTCMEGRLHEPCKAVCKRILTCGHECKASCHQNCPPCSAECENRCVHSRCQHKCGDPCTSCIEPCAWRCVHYKCTKLCSEPCDRPRCNKACQAKLPCGHGCIGLCGEPCPQKCRICDKDEVQELFFGNEDENEALFVELEDCGHIIEVTGLDRWMDSSEDSSNRTEAVKLKACPKCTVPIRSNLRYGKIIKKKLQLIEKVKLKVLGTYKRGDVLREEIQQNTEFCRLDRMTKNIILDRLDQRSDDIITEQESVYIRNVILLLTRLDNLSKQITNQITDVPQGDLKLKHHMLLEGINIMRKWIIKQRKELCEQEEHEADREITRLYLVAQTLECDIRVRKTKPTIPSVVQRQYAMALQLLDRKTPLTSDDENTVKEALKQMERAAPCSGLGITDEERKQILQAMNLSKGHWYHCPNGHVYCIGDCGGAMEEAKCPECQATIGGHNHRLHSGNAVATEMDGARHSAWSEQANLDNYDPDMFFDI